MLVEHGWALELFLRSSFAFLVATASLALNKSRHHISRQRIAHFVQLATIARQVLAHRSTLFVGTSFFQQWQQSMRWGRAAIVRSNALSSSIPIAEQPGSDTASRTSRPDLVSQESVDTVSCRINRCHVHGQHVAWHDYIPSSQSIFEQSYSITWRRQSICSNEQRVPGALSERH